MFNLLASGPGREVSRIVLWGMGIGSISMVVWTIGPMISIFGFRPLEGYIARNVVVVLLVAAASGLGGFTFWRRKKKSEKIAEGIAGEAAKDDNDSVVLKDKMKDALTTLKNAGGGKAGYLYDLPWYLLIGPPGSGKTTALVNSGLKFPLSRGAKPAAIAGVGGTRYCDWWFTDDAVLIDTAGRYTTQDSDAKSDQQSWYAFLDLLKKNRPRQPINGVMVAISLEDLMTMSSAELSAHADAIRARLLELHDRLKVDFPVYALFTKGDLVAGFMEFFGNLGEQGRKQVWGATFQTGDKTINLVGEVPYEFDALIERLNNDLTDRLQEEPAPTTRVSLYGFPAQMSALKRPIFNFLNQIFEPTRYHANATLRGFYFTSGTQEGTPIDQVIGALARSFGAEELAGASYSGKGKSYFLTDLINKVIIGEAAWVSTDRAAVRRAMIIKAAAFATIALLSLAATAAWWVSYNRNSTLITLTQAGAKEYEAAGGPLPKQAVVSDRDLARVLPLLHRLRHLPSGYAVREASTPMAATFGLSQRDRIQSSSENAYRIALERMFRSRLVFRMEEQLEANRNNPSFIYEALKVYLMLGGQQPAERDLIVGWMRRDWSDNLYPGAANAEGRKALEEHLLAMLDLEAGQEPLMTLHGPLVEECQKTLARLSLAQRAYELLKSQARSSAARDWVVARAGGPDVGLVFEAVGSPTLDTVTVPGFFTYVGFHRAFIERLSDISEQLKRERWVLGAIGEQSAVSEQYDRLVDDLLQIYARDFVGAWREALTKLRLKRLIADKPRYIALTAISSVTSPMKTLLESIRDETTLTRERPGFNKPADGKPGETKTPTLPALMKETAPGANIEAAFKHFHVVVEGDGSRKPIEAVVANLGEIANSLTLSTTNPSQSALANSQLQVQVANLKANAARLPPPFSDMMRGAANDFEGDVARSSQVQLSQSLGDQVTRTCQQIVANRYPFVRGSDREVPIQDFGRLFGQGGILDKFFTQNLAPLADTSKREWAYRPDSRLGITLNPAALREFQRAAEIRDAFFPGGGNQPMINLAVIPPLINTPGTVAKMEINGVPIESKAGSPNAPVSVQWPGAAAIGRTAITVTNEAAMGMQAAPPSVLERTGAWSLFRMLDAAGARPRGDRIVAQFVVGGRDLQYQFGTSTVQNPFNLPALREFRCPSGI